jgi:hypothetical protein
MTITTFSDAEPRGGVLGQIRGWFAPPDRSKATAGGVTRLEHFNDHLLRDMGLFPYPSRQQRRLMMRL